MNTTHTRPARRTVAALAAGALAVPVLALSLAPAQAAPADVDRYGACGTGDFEFSVDRDNGGYEVEAQLEHLPRGQKWRITLRHNGKTYANTVRRADREGDIDVDRFRPDTAGKDTFTFRAKRIGASGACSATITQG